MPYRVHLPTGGEAQLGGWVLNPLSRAATAPLVVPEGWTGSEVTVDLDPREQKEIVLSLRPDEGAACRRQPVALDLTVDGRPFGHVAEALVTVGCDRF